MATLSLSSTGQAIAQAGGLIRNAQGAPFTGYAPNGSFVQGGVATGSPYAGVDPVVPGAGADSPHSIHQQTHQFQHQQNNPSLWTLGAAALTNTTDPHFLQGTLGQMEGISAPAAEPGGLSMGRLYINTAPANPYQAATPFTDPADRNRQLNNAQIWTDVAAGSAGYQSAGGTWIARTHPNSSAPIFNAGLTGFVDRGVVNAAMDPGGGAVAVWLTQGAGATRHLGAVQQHNASLLGSRIFFSQQHLATPSGPSPFDPNAPHTAHPGPQPSGLFSPEGEGGPGLTSRIDPWAAFVAQLGAIPEHIPSHRGGYQAPVTGQESFTIGYIQDNGAAHHFSLSDRHFQGTQHLSHSGYNSDWGSPPSPSDLAALLGQELNKAADGHAKAQALLGHLDVKRIETEALFMQGLDLRRHVHKDQWSLLDGLKNGQIAPGHPDYEQALALTRQAFTQALGLQAEYDLKPKHTKESAAWQARHLDLSRTSDQDLFNQGYDLFDKKADPRGEQLLRDLREGRLVVGSAEYQEARALAEARFRVDHQQALEPPKKTNPLKQLVAVVVAAVATYFTAGWASGWASTAMGGVFGTSAAGTAASAIASQAVVGAVSGFVSSSISTTIMTGSVSKGLEAGLKSAASGAIGAGLGEFIGGGPIGQALANTVAQKVVYGGDLGDLLMSNIINAGVDMIAKDIAGKIGANTEVGSFEKYAAHAALGCVAGTIRSQSGDGCVPAAAGAVAGHMAADSIQTAMVQAKNDPTNANPIALMFAAAPGRTLDEGVIFLGGLIGGAAATLAGGGKNVQTDFGVGQGAAQMAVEHNYLKYDEAKKLQALKEQDLKGQCTGNCKAEILRLETVDRQRNEELARCEGSSSAACQKAFKDVRLAAADYVRQDANWALSGQTVLFERQETLKLAQGTTDGKLQGAVQGYWEALKETAASVKEGAQTLYAAAKGDEAAWQAIEKGAGAAADYIKEPSNWPYLLGAMTPEQREQLALAYESGNGSEIGRLMGQQLSNLPIGGGPVGSIKKIDDVIEAAGKAPTTGPRLTVRDHYNHHNEMRTDVIEQLKSQGYKIAGGEASFGNSCGVGRCRPDILYEAPDGTKGIIEIKTGNADLSIRQTEIFPQIKDGNAIPVGGVARRFGLRPGIPLKDQGYPNGIPIEVREFPGAGQ